MARDYTITWARNDGEKPNPHGGTLVKWKLKLQGTEAGDDEVYCQKKPGNELAPGMTIYGRLEKGEFGWRIFPEQNPSAGAGGGNFKAPSYQKEGMTKDDYWGNKDQRDIEGVRRMGRAHSQEMAIRVMAALGLGQPTEQDRAAIKEWTDWFVQDLDADVGGGSAGSHVLRGHTTADVSAEPPHGKARREGRSENFSEGVSLLARTAPGGDLALPEKSVEASPQLKARLTKEFGKAQLSRDAMKAVVLFRCRSEKATKEGAMSLLRDLADGATHDQLIAEVHDAARAGDAVAIRARKLIPSDVPLNEPEPEVVEPNGDVPF